MEKYIVKKQFAHDSDIFNTGDVLELSADDATAFLAEGNIEAYVEEKELKVEVDTKGISEAIEAGFAKFAPTKGVADTKKSMSYGEFLQGMSRKELTYDDLKTVNITTGNQGGNQTESFLDPMVENDLIRESGIAQMATLIPLQGLNNVYKFNVVSSVGSGVAVVAESGTVGASQPLITNFSISLSKLMYRMDVTEEALQDTGALTAEISSTIPAEFSKYIERGMLTGQGPFTGVIGDTNTVDVAKESGQTDGTIVAENIDKMYASCKRPGRSVFVMSRSAYAAVQGLEDSAGNRLFQGPNGIGDAVFGTLKGLPIMVSDFCNVVGQSGDVVLGDFSKYKIAAKGGLSILSSEHVKFLEDETVFKFRHRLGGLPFGIKLTATDATEISDFVTVADRGSF